MTKVLLELLDSRSLLRKYAEIKTKSSKISPSKTFSTFSVYGCTLAVIISISNVTVVKANCKIMITIDVNS